MQGKEEFIEIYRKMLTIKRFEEKVFELNKRDVRKIAHTYVGKESITVGVCGNLRKDDYVTDVGESGEE